MRSFRMATFALALSSATMLVPVAFAADAVTEVYPIDRATLLSGGKLDFKVEFPGKVDESAVKVKIGDKELKDVFKEKVTYIADENGSGGSSIEIKGVSIEVPGLYPITVEGKGADGTTFTRTVTWDVFGTPAKPKAKNIIFLIGDGMTVSMRTAARIMSKGNTEGKANARLNMDSLPQMAFIGTSSTDSIAADSANTMSAYMTGQKSAVNALGVYASRAKGSLDHPRQETIAEALRRAAPEKSIGIVSNAEIEDATPAAVVSHTRRRADKAEIVGMFYDVKPEVILGGGSAYFLPQATPGSKRKDDTDYVAKFKDAGYQFVTSKDELAGLAGGANGKLLGLFHTGNMDGTLDHRLGTGTVKKFPNQPDVPDMMKTALDTLSKDPDGFFLMVEGALIDKFEHPLDWDRAVYETITFDKMVGMAQEFVKTHPDTLLIVTADHTHGTSVIGTIDDDRPGTGRDKVGVYQEAGFPNYVDADKDGYPDKVDVSRRLAIFANNFPDYYETWGPKMDGPFVPAVKNEKGEYVANEAYKAVPGATFREGNLPRTQDTGVHAVDDVVLQAMGPGSEELHGYMENSDVYRVLADTFALGANAKK